MKNTQKKLLALLLCLMMVLAASACKLSDGETTADTKNTEDTAIDYEAVVAKVGDSDKYTVSLGDLNSGYQSMLSFYTNYGMSAPTADEDIQSYQDMVMEGLVTDQMLLYQAELAGLSPLSDEEAEAAKKEADASLDALLQDYVNYATEQGAADPEAEAINYINEDLANYGYTVDWEGYKTTYYESAYNAKVTAKLQEKIQSAATVDDADVQAYYDELLASQKESYDATPSSYVTASEDYEKGGQTPVLYTPDGFLRVKIVAVQPEGTLDEGYTTLKTEMTALEAEYGALALSGGDAARMKELQADYNDKKAEADTLFEAYVKDARQKAVDAYAALKAGTSFDEVLKEYGQDEMFTTYETFAAKGRLLGKEAGSDAWDDAIREAALKLEDGAYSDVIEVDGAYYIVMRVGNEAAAELSFDEVKDILTPIVLAEKQNTVWENQKSAWLDEDGLVTYFEDVYRDVVGK